MGGFIFILYSFIYKNNIIRHQSMHSLIISPDVIYHWELIFIINIMLSIFFNLIKNLNFIYKNTIDLLFGILFILVSVQN